MRKIFKESNISNVEKKINLESYEKPYSEVIPLLSEGLICCSNIGGNVTDPEEGEGGYWPGFDRE